MQKFNEWQQIYLEKNEDLEEVKQLVRAESRKTIETSVPQPIEKETKPKDAKRSSTGARPRTKYATLYYVFIYFEFFSFKSEF